MKDRGKRYMLLLLLFFAWMTRYLVVNQGSLLPHPRAAIKEYSVGETVDLSNTISYYQTENHNCRLTVQKATLWEDEAFRSSYQMAANGMLRQADVWIELEIAAENPSESTAELTFLPLILSGIDWFSYFSPEATAYANDIVSVGETQMSSIQLQSGECVSFRLVYPLQAMQFPSSRWQTLFEEDIWLIITIRPVENRIAVTL